MARYGDLTIPGLGGAFTITNPAWSALTITFITGPDGGPEWRIRGSNATAATVSGSQANAVLDGWNGTADDGYGPWGLLNHALVFDLGFGVTHYNGVHYRRAMFRTTGIVFDNADNDHNYFDCCYFCSPSNTIHLAGTPAINFFLDFNGCTFKTPRLAINYVACVGTYVFDGCLFDGTAIYNSDPLVALVFRNCTFVGKSQSQAFNNIVAGAYTHTGCTFDAVLDKDLPTDFADISRETMLYSLFGLPEQTGSFGGYDIGFDSSGDRQGPGAFYFGIAAATATASVDSGKAPLSVGFAGSSDASIVAYHWDFGDGFASDDQNPSHTYDGPGTYTVTYTITDKLGNTSTTTLTIYVYNADYSIGYAVNHTDFCARFAMPREPAQGEGWAFYNGESWPLAIGRIGTLEIINAADDRIPMVMDCNSFEVHELGDPDQWEDGEDEYGSTEIESEILLPEVTPPVGAAAVLRHSQTHVYVKPWFKDLRSTGDFDADGYRPNFAMNVFARIDSSPNDFVETVRVPKEGQVVFDRHFQSPFVQFGIRPKVAPWRIPKIQSWLVEEDIAAGPDDKLMSEDTWASEWSEPLLWIGRDRINPFLNRATGETASGTYASLITGPDAYSQSAMALGTNTIGTTIAALTGDFTMAWWIKGITIPVALYSDGTLTIRISSASGRLRLRFEDGDNDLSVWLDQLYVDWTMISVVRSGDNLLVYENGALTNTVHMADAYIEYGGTVVLCSGGCSVWDVRAVARAVSLEAHEYFYNDVVDHAGNSTCWIW